MKTINFILVLMLINISLSFSQVSYTYVFKTNVNFSMESFTTFNENVKKLFLTNGSIKLDTQYITVVSEKNLNEVEVKTHFQDLNVEILYLKKTELFASDKEEQRIKKETLTDDEYNKWKLNKHSNKQSNTSIKID